MHRKGHMEIPSYVFMKMRTEFKDLQPLFYKFAQSHINPHEIQQLMDRVDTRRNNNDLLYHDDPYKKNKDAIRDLKIAVREVGIYRQRRIIEVWKKCNGKWPKSFIKTVWTRYNKEIKDPDTHSSWRDFTALYPDKFDGDNISKHKNHSCKFKSIQDSSEPAVWVKGHVCHSIQALIWRITGLYKEFRKESDVITSEDCRVDVVEELIRLSHYVLDMSTIVHLMFTSNSFHSNFEEDLDLVIDKYLPEVEFTINRDVTETFLNDAYGEADERAKVLFKKNSCDILQHYGEDNEVTTRFLSTDNGADMAKNIIQNACQNLADFWMYALELMKVEETMFNHVLNEELDFSL